MTDNISSHPGLTICGFLASIMITILPSMDQLENDVRFFGVCIGIVVALITIYAKIVEIRYRKMKMNALKEQK